MGDSLQHVPLGFSVFDLVAIHHLPTSDHLHGGHLVAALLHNPSTRTPVGGSDKMEIVGGVPATGARLVRSGTVNGKHFMQAGENLWLTL